MLLWSGNIEIVESQKLTRVDNDQFAVLPTLRGKPMEILDLNPLNVIERQNFDITDVLSLSVHLRSRVTTRLRHDIHRNYHHTVRSRVGKVIICIQWCALLLGRVSRHYFILPKVTFCLHFGHLPNRLTLCAPIAHLYKSSEPEINLS